MIHKFVSKKGFHRRNKDKGLGLTPLLVVIGGFDRDRNGEVRVRVRVLGSLRWMARPNAAVKSVL